MQLSPLKLAHSNTSTDYDTRRHRCDSAFKRTPLCDAAAAYLKKGTASSQCRCCDAALKKWYLQSHSRLLLLLSLSFSFSNFNNQTQYFIKTLTLIIKTYLLDTPGRSRCCDAALKVIASIAFTGFFSSFSYLSLSIISTIINTIMPPLLPIKTSYN